MHQHTTGKENKKTPETHQHGHPEEQGSACCGDCRNGEKGACHKAAAILNRLDEEDAKNGEAADQHKKNNH
jgi:hypothetical protein